MSGFVVLDLQGPAGRILHAAAAGGRLAQGYLFYGLEGTGKWAAAVRAAQLIMCPAAADENHQGCPVCKRIAAYNHPDIHWVIPLVARDRQKVENDSVGEGGSVTSAQGEELERIFSAKREEPWAPLEYPRRPYITMTRIRALQYELARTPIEGPRKVGIIINATTMRQDAQSVLLKTIEEPPPDSHIILTATDKSALLPTILSRCQPVRFLPLPREAIAHRLVEQAQLDEDEACRVAELSGGSWTRAQRLATEEWDLWRKAAEMLFAAAATGTVDDLVRSVDTVFKQRPDLDKILFLFEIWQSMLHRAALKLATAGPDQTPAGSETGLASIFDCRNTLHDARAAIVGNVTPRIATAAALLDIQAKLHAEGGAGFRGAFANE